MPNPLSLSTRRRMSADASDNGRSTSESNLKARLPSPWGSGRRASWGLLLGVAAVGNGRRARDTRQTPNTRHQLQDTDACMSSPGRPYHASGGKGPEDPLQAHARGGGLDGGQKPPRAACFRLCPHLRPPSSDSAREVPVLSGYNHPTEDDLARVEQQGAVCSAAALCAATQPSRCTQQSLAEYHTECTQHT